MLRADQADVSQRRIAKSQAKAAAKGKPRAKAPSRLTLRRGGTFETPQNNSSASPSAALTPEIQEAMHQLEAEVITEKYWMPFLSRALTEMR